MKNFYLFIFLLAIQYSTAQQTILDTFMHDGIERSYILYVPAIYDATEGTPLVFNFHGYTSNAAAQMFYGDFRPIADTANFLVVHPMGTLDPNGITYWNANWGGAVDDIGFTSALIDRISGTHNLDLTRVYSTGMSNGGFMSYALACDLSDRIAAVASVTGSMLTANLAFCDPNDLPVPAMQIHGTDDGVVPYDGTTGGFGFVPIEDLVSFWTGKNSCNNAVPTITQVPDIDMTDGCTAEHWVYDDCANNTEMEFFKIFGGAHTWPGNAFSQPGTCRDFNASEEIWRFFNQFDINGRRVISSQEETEYQGVIVGPVPFSHELTLYSNQFEGSVRIFNSQGQLMDSFDTNRNVEHDIACQEWATGLYWLETLNQESGERQVEKILKFN